MNNRDIKRDLLVTGLVGLLAAILLGEVPPGQRPADAKSASTLREQTVDRGDFPSSIDSISLSSELWADPWAAIEASERSTPRSDESIDGATASELVRDTLDLGQLLVMPMIVDGKRLDQSKLSRVRTRHALELALAQSGFKMQYPHRMTYVNCKVDFHLSLNRTRDWDFDVPVKLYRNDDSKRLILIVWIKEQFLGRRPLGSMAQILNAILDLDGSGSTLPLRSSLVLCGPTYSETLEKIRNESVSHDPDAKHDLYEFYSKWRHCGIANPRCTATSTADIHEIRLRKLTDSTAEVVHSASESKDYSLPVHHFIGTDAQLVEVLKEELNRRGLTEKTSGRIALFVDQGPHKYIDSLVTDFTRGGSQAPALEPIVVPYLKGIATDGNVEDYLRQTLKQIQAEGDNSNRVVAVGVFGSDGFDKLAILAAARSAFPVATFFTTDLDARFTDFSAPGRYSACRNLIVASQFGFRLDGDLFNASLNDMPSFGGPYQAATFLAVSVMANAFRNDDLSIQSAKDGLLAPRNGRTQQDLFDVWNRKKSKDILGLRPLLFEIGRKGPVQLTRDTLPHSFPIRQPVTETAYLKYAVAFPMLLTAVLVILNLWSYYSTTLADIREDMLRKGKRFGRDAWSSLKYFGPSREKGIPTGRSSVETVQSMWLTLVVIHFVFLLVFAILNDATESGEPISLLDATSIWPALFILWVVSTASSGLVVGSWKEMKSGDQLALDSKASKRSLEQQRVFHDSCAVSLIFLVALAVYAFLFEVGIPPARSLSARTLAWVTLVVSCVLLIELATWTALHILSIRKSIRDKKAEEFLGEGDDTKESLQRRYSELEDVMDAGKKSSRKLVAPAILTLMYAIARFPLLDSWQIHASSYAILLTPLVFSILVAFSMRNTARRFKNETLHAIDAKRILLVNVGKSPGTNTKGELAALSESHALVGNLEDGPFGPITSDPLLGGIFLVAMACLTGPFREVLLAVLTMLSS